MIILVYYNYTYKYQLYKIIISKTDTLIYIFWSNTSNKRFLSKLFVLPDSFFFNEIIDLNL